MNKRNKTIGIEKAQKAGEKFILGKYPFTNVTFEKIELINDGVLQVYELLGYLKLTKWPISAGRKSLCKIQVNAYNADIVSHHGT